MGWNHSHWSQVWSCLGHDSRGPPVAGRLPSPRWDGQAAPPSPQALLEQLQETGLHVACCVPGGRELRQLAWSKWAPSSPAQLPPAWAGALTGQELGCLPPSSSLHQVLERGPHGLPVCLTCR
ncbi:hypothetical protein H1C71_005635 [Ictidomys tridecemlineatus]|nr:hypothetical protein H1C71_005635 [Ictidomys tridecemlineatus]